MIDPRVKIDLAGLHRDLSNLEMSLSESKYTAQTVLPLFCRCFEDPLLEIRVQQKPQSLALSA